VSERASQHLEDRYGRPQESRGRYRGAVTVLAVVVVALGIGAALVAYQRLGQPDVEGTLIGYRLIDDQTVEVTMSVRRADPLLPVVCIVRARSGDGSETGRRELLIPPAEQSTVQVTTTVKSSAPPVMGDVYGCGTDVPGYLVAP
jgi:hypothetical protein